MKYVIANWKMNMDLKKVNQWLNGFEKVLKDTKNTTIVIAPSNIHIPLVKIFADNHPNIKVSAQNISTENTGAHTGETGIDQIKDFCGYCIVGHSELSESKDVKLTKARLCIEKGVTPIICSKNPEEDWKDIKNINEGFLLTWEDPNNISQNGIYNEKPYEEVFKEIDVLIGKLGFSGVIYGGSVNERNSDQLSKTPGLIGVLVGNASLDPNTFWKIIENFENN